MQVYSNDWREECQQIGKVPVGIKCIDINKGN